MNLTHAHFAEPRWLWLAVLGPLFLFLMQRYAAWARQRDLGRMAAPAFIAGLTQSHSRLRRAIKDAALIVAFGGLGLAMARPQWGVQSESGRLLGQDIIFVLDCSRSMLAADVAPSRLQRAKLAIMDFVQREGRGRVGLVAFAGQAFLQCPLTYDYSAFHDALTMADDRVIPVPGTDVGRALDEGFRAFEKSARQKFLVLITDGEDLEKGGVRMAETLAKQGVVVFAIGVGTATGAEIQFVSDAGRMEVLHDSNGEVVRSRLDETTLRQIAEVTHGEYHSLGRLGEGMSQVRRSVENLKNAFVSSAGRKLGVDRFHGFLAAGLALLVVESLLGTRKRARV